MGTKDKLTELKYNESSTVSSVRSFQERPNPVRELCVPIAKLLSQLHLHNLLLDRRLDAQGINIAKNGKQQLIGHVLQGHDDLTVGMEEGVRGATPSMGQMAKVEQIQVIVQETRGDNGFQNTSPSKGLYEPMSKSSLPHPRNGSTQSGEPLHLSYPL